ncbi:efflux RND transporter periplasmic adaptor subunit [Brucella sp. HL-2]|nr:efflux RND transporter periplasmic adaptor subunit [Brucella sp. HL-2]MCV9907626.1 efflux RND transporter periplasmic adaptor subunit [Brucella sp. HL-2]
MKPKSKRRIKWRRWLAILIALLIVGYLAVRQSTKEAPLPAISVIHRGNLESSVLATGVLKPKNLVAIGAQATGRILSLKIKPGQRVKKDDVVALIDSTTQQNELQKAQATLRQNEATRDQNNAQLELAKLDLVRNELMIGKNAVARSEYDKAVSTVKEKQAVLASSEATIAAAQIEVKIAETNLAYTRITAPTDGTVLATVVQEGQTVNAAQSAPTIAILGQLDTMTVEADISEADITLVREGLPLYFTISGQNSKRYEAKLETIDPAPDTIVNDKSFAATSASASASATTASAVYYKGIFSVPNPDGFLKTYMTAEIHILLAEEKDVLLAPVSALRSSGEPNKAIVRIVTSHGAITGRTVETGITDKINTSIQSGLNEGDRIVTDNQATDPSIGAGSVSVGF